MEYFFVTGMLRSGTTLLSNVLSKYKGVVCRSQEFTQSLMSAKAEFLKSRNLFPYHHYSNYFPKLHEYADLEMFLEEKQLADNYKKLFSEKKEILLAGDKEVFCEEYITHFLNNSIKVLLIVRNPKDVIASMHTGKSIEFSGNHRPVLFDLRNWRKSVAFAIENTGKENFFFLRYEDLCNKTEEAMQRISDFLKASPEGNAEVQNSNSSFWNSFKGIKSKSVGIGKHLLEASLLNFIEAVCFPEMKFLGYDTDDRNRFNETVIEDFIDPFPDMREEFRSFNYEEEKDRELSRLKGLKKDLTRKEAGELFVFPGVWESLRK